MFAILGDIAFEVVGSPESLSSARRYEYVEQRVVQDKPRLQWIADGLETMEFELLLHRSFTNPALRLFELETAASLHEALPLVFGSGEFRGFFVITSIAAVSHQHSAAGEPIAIRARIGLREWPLELDPNVPPIPGFAPIGIVAAASTLAAGLTAPAASPPSSAAGVSALLTLGGPSGPPSRNVQAGDIPPAVITRSMLG